MGVKEATLKLPISDSLLEGRARRRVANLGLQLMALPARMAAMAIVALLLVMMSSVALGASFTNPLFAGADPGILFDPLTQSYYVTTTGGDGSGGFLPIFASTDLIHWTQVHSRASQHRPR